ncbi:MAG: amino acid permease [Bacteroidetes bacterium]|nr:amino acid permease [Bacteroidota bacterium]MBS1977140.1 amino acid permease [Bacteroidota bacterium]
MIGSGVFLLPASLAVYGGISLLGWIGSSIGAIALALLFSNLSKIIPNAVGGPYAYTHEGLGEFAGFIVAWGYWISIWCTNAAIAVTFVSYLTVFIPVLATNSLLSVCTGLGAVWLLTWVNSMGVKETGMVQLITTILKLTPLILISVVGLFYMDFSNYTPLNVSAGSDFAAITASATLTLFAFQGLESATVPSANIESPEKTIPRATMIGTVVTMLVYVLGSAAVMGMIPPAELQQSNAPYADAAAIIWGEGARKWVAFGALVSAFGALNGWILLQGQIPMAAAQDKMFPEIFRKVNKRGLPVTALVVSSALISALTMMRFSRGLTDTFTFMILLTTVCVLVAYLFSAAAYGMILLRRPEWKEHPGKLAIAAVAFGYSIWAVVGTTQDAVYWGFLAILVGIPFFVWMKRVRNE